MYNVFGNMLKINKVVIIKILGFPFILDKNITSKLFE
jgi:hypothetical protein